MLKLKKAFRVALIVCLCTIYLQGMAAMKVEANASAGENGNLPVMGADAVPAAAPELLITELVQDTDNYAGYDAFEFVELYNTTDQPISLQGYKLSLIAGAATNKWEQAIDRKAVIEPFSTFVIWTHLTEIDPVVTEGFNSYYYDSYQLKWLSDKQLYRMRGVGGLVNSNKHTVVVSDPQGEEIVRASYNDTAKDVSLGTSTVYSYPLDGSKLMRKTAIQQTPTPGWVYDEQVPAREKRHTTPPAAPQGLQAKAGDGFVKLTWLANGETDIDSYRIYKNGVLEWSVAADKHKAVISQLWGNVTVNLAVTAVDTSGNESQQAIVSATPGHQILKQKKVGSSAPNPAFDAFWRVSEKGAKIPGLHQDVVPQGIAYDAENDWLIMSAYMRDKRPSSLSVIDANSGKLIKSVVLKNDDGTPYVGHAGGVTVSKANIWVSSGEYLHRLPKEALELAADNDELQFADKFLTPTRGSSAAYHNGVLWAGDYYDSGSPTDPSHAMVNRDGDTFHAWLAGYELDPVTDLPVDASVPSYILSIADSVQGATFTDDYVITSQSYNRYADSHLTRFMNPLQDTPHATVTYNGASVPVWFLDNQAKKTDNNLLTLPAMSEGLIAVGNELFVLFESGATRYRYTTTFVSDHIRKVKFDLWDAE
ncbi:lamin tail domain-containing protein [Paenibacillus sp. GCM10027626]|uniref:lamin tail domain-containing protein n=1 Tax=Paenibacillus sp. GCM10027626 TaxID=3273411 RepID=UPI00362D165B